LARRVADHLNPAAVVVFRHDAVDELRLNPLRTMELRDFGEMRVELLAL
jgi:hypothetical protein